MNECSRLTDYDYQVIDTDISSPEKNNFLLIWCIREISL